MLSELFFIVMAIGLSLIVLRYYLARNNGEQKDEDETSLKDMMLTGGSAPPKQKEEENDQNAEKSFWENVYSGKGPQPKYMRNIANRERHRAIDAGKLAASKEEEDKDSNQ